MSDPRTGQPAQLPPSDRWFSSERALGALLSALVGTVVLAALCVAVGSWNRYRTAQAHLADRSRPDGGDPDLLTTIAVVGFVLSLLAAWTVLVVWLWRVRWNSELFCRAPHRLRRAWVIGGWLCPALNLWYPRQLVEDVLVSSDPRTPARTVTLDGLPRPAVVWCWWLPGLAAAISVLSYWLVLLGEDTADQLAVAATLASAAAGFLAISGGVLVWIVQRVDRWQALRPWTVWWAVD